MKIEDLKGLAVVRLANLEAALREQRKTVVLIEADLIKARREAAMTDGAVQATQQAIADLDAAAAAGKPALS